MGLAQSTGLRKLKSILLHLRGYKGHVVGARFLMFHARETSEPFIVELRKHSFE